MQKIGGTHSFTSSGAVTIAEAMIGTTIRARLVAGGTGLLFADVDDASFTGFSGSAFLK